MKKKFLGLMLAIFSVISIAHTQAVSPSSSSEWWNQDWHYRIKVEVYGGSFAREDEPVEILVDFESLFYKWGISGTLDTKSIRVIDQSDSPREVLSQFELSSGEIIWLTGFLEAGCSKTYYVYFDILENSPKSPPSYYSSMETGGILVLPAGNHISVIYKIGGAEYETARIDESNGRISYLRPPFGSPLIEDTASRFGPLMEGGMYRGSAVSITGGPVRYKIEFHYEPGNSDASDVLSDCCYTFYYVPNGHEVKTKLNITWTAFRSLFPQILGEKWPVAFEIEEENATCFHTAFMATDIDSATLYDIPSAWGPIDGDAVVSPGLSDNFWGVYGESGGVGIIPVIPDYDHWCVDGYRDRNGWNWSTSEISLLDFMGIETYEWSFWINGYDHKDWNPAKDFGNRVEEPVAVEADFHMFSPCNFKPGVRPDLPFRKKERDFDRAFTFYDREIEFHRDSSNGNRLSLAWLPPGWNYRKSHTINGSPVGLLSDYVIRIVVNYGSGVDSGEDVYLDNNCRPDFGDVRFTGSDGSTQLDYWIEKKTDGDYAIFWVEVNSIPASPGSTTIYIYYDNIGATTTSNGKNTFDWFDDFVIDSSTDYDIGRHATVWHGLGAYNPYYDPVNRRVAFDTGDNFSGGWMVRSANLTIQNFAAKVTFGIAGSYPWNTTNGILGRWTGNAAYYGFYVAGGYYSASPALVRDARTTVIASPPSNTYHPFGGIPHTAELRIYGNSLTGIYNEGEADEVVLTATDSTHAGAGQVEVIVAQATGWFDSLFVRKYVEPEPNHGPWGVEEGIPAYFRVTGNSSMTAGTSNELTITAYDAGGNVATGYSGSQNLTFSGPSNAPDVTAPTVEGTNVGTATAINFTNGVSDPGGATLIAYRAETIQVDVTDGTIDSFGDPSYDLDLTVNPGAADNLNFLQQPTDAATSAVITPAVTVEVRDQWNNVCTSDNTTSVAVAINNNPGGGTLSGTTPQTASSGVAAFGDLSIDMAGIGYTLDATSIGLTTATSGNFNITAGTAGYFRITGNSSMTAGTSNELTITAYDAGGNVATGYSGSQNLTFSGPSNAPDVTAPTVEGTNVGTATAINFTNGVSDPGGATLIAYRAETIQVDVTDGTIDSFGDPSYDLDLTVNPGAADNLNFLQQPTDAATSAVITPAVTVEVRDQWNNVCTSDNTTSVAVAINNNPGGGTLSGTTPQTASSGVAAFGDLSIDMAGIGYTLDATSIGLTTVTSNAFNISAGTASMVVIEDAADGTGTEVDTRTIASGGSFTVYSISRDSNDNFVANEVVNWSLTNRSGEVVPGDLVPSGSNRSAAFTGHHAGAASIRASHATLGNDTTGLITVTNRPPVAIAGPDQNVNVRDSVQLDGSSSYDPENDPLTYSWDFIKKPSQSQALLNNPNSVHPSFTPDQGGEYVIQLVVNDGIDDSAPDDVSVFAKSPPVALFVYQPKTGFVPCKFLFDASASYDPDGHIVSYEWDFGDFSKGIGVNPSHIYTSKGEFLISLKVTDNDGLTDIATAKIKVLICCPPINVSLKREINRSLFRKEAFHTLSWSSNPENNDLTIINHRIYRKKAGGGDGSYQMIGTVPGNTFIYVDRYLDISEKFVYVITSVESSGHESEKSSSVRN